ncbi:hypothetical protein [Actinophytocola sp.]|uniref:hypothetical protein n=1 Tax=Actinophytocola sp. TaxID=1872138 RepID=UPI003D6ACB08
MRAKWVGIGGLAALTVAAAGLAPALAAPREQVTVAAANDDPAFVQVYNDNVENLPTVDLACPGDWQDLVYYLKRAPLKPDIFTIQQISNRSQLDFYLARLSNDLGEDYAGVIAEASPAAMNSPCGPPKDYQTNAVIYRKARFTDRGLDARTWQAQSDESGSCASNDQARTKAVKVMLHDKIANKDLTVASVHWPTAASGGTACADSNARETATEMTEDGYGGSLLIFGGDVNISDLSGGSFRSWHRLLNGDEGGGLGYRDAGYAGCGGSLACLGDNWTIGGNRRIDFVFARKPAGGLPGVTGFHTITFNEGDAADRAETGTDRADRDYSDHRAVMARVHY